VNSHPCSGPLKQLYLVQSGGSLTLCILEKSSCDGDIVNENDGKLRRNETRDMGVTVGPTDGDSSTTGRYYDGPSYTSKTSGYSD